MITKMDDRLVIAGDEEGDIKTHEGLLSCLIAWEVVLEGT